MTDKKSKDSQPVEDSSDGKCANHPDRDGKLYTNGGSIEVVYCDECVPDWFED